QGTFTGSVTGLDDEGTPCHFFYLGKGNIATTPTGTAAASIPLASQDGTLRGENGAMKYHMGYGTTDVTVESGEYQGYVMMNTKIAIAHINFTTDGTQPYTGSVTMGGTGVSNTLSVNPDGTFSGDGTDGITIGNGDGESGERYVTLIPTGTTDVLNVAFTGDATGSMTFAKGIHENKFYGMSEAIAVTLEAHEYVDLGLSVKWATCNVGADSPEKYGDYFQWGGVTPVTSTSINVSWAGCPFTNGTYSSSNKNVFTKYVPTGKTEYWAGSGDPDNKLVLDPEDDAAHVNWGGDWRMPTTEEWKELKDNCTLTWTTQGGKNGYCVTGPNGKSIFLPAAGYRYSMSVNAAGTYGYYWSSSLDSSDPSSAFSLYFRTGGMFDPQKLDDRYYGCSVRPVRAAR
ncbi:MAG: fibrobacter succinogenes major paralogous domain-containing protein, partial [Bacteroidales bacterium]|nr:fibrobacter succinogenes major paralogous domain-containing protein [Bacteroidales bacterium]